MSSKLSKEEQKTAETFWYFVSIIAIIISAASFLLESLSGPIYAALMVWFIIEETSLKPNYIARTIICSIVSLWAVFGTLSLLVELNQGNPFAAFLQATMSSYSISTLIYFKKSDFLGKEKNKKNKKKEEDE